MKCKIAAAAVTALAMLAFGSAPSAAGPRCANGCIEFTPAALPDGIITLDAGGFSQSTGEHMNESSAFFEAHVESPDGSLHPDYGRTRRLIYIFKTMGGQYVLRVLHAVGRASH